jgi:hypothetical protein
MTYLTWHDAPLAEAAKSCQVAIGVYVLKDVFSIVKVGQARTAPVWDRLEDHARTYNALFTHAYWAMVPAHQVDGVETYLGRLLKPLDGTRFPDVTPIPVNLPYALEPNRPSLAPYGLLGPVLNQAPVPWPDTSALANILAQYDNPAVPAEPALLAELRRVFLKA